MTRLFVLMVAVSLGSSVLSGAGATEKKKTRKTSRTHSSAVSRHVAAKKRATSAKKTTAAASHTARTRSRSRKARVSRGPWREPTYADSTLGDNVDGEDLTVRRAAVEALGSYNGTVVAVDAQTGRVLTVVNQKLAMKSGFQPCSTIKIVAALAALSENVIERTTMIRLYGRTSIDLTTALARSNNLYFASVGQKLGFDRVSYYAKLFGLGEKAGLGIADEQPGILPEAPPKNGGVGMMTSFGEGIALTPLELAGLLVSVANGGTLYYLQYPRSAEEAANFVPRVKRHLDIAPFIPEIKPGMAGAVEYGTARRIGFDPNEPIFGKTGTCTDSRTPTHLGWFGSFNDTGNYKMVVVVLLTGGRPINGPVASGIGGEVYKILQGQNYFQQARTTTPVALISTQNCCNQ